MTPLVVIPQHFGCLVFDRRTSRYAPFDRETTAILRAALDEPAWRVAARHGPPARAFVAHFERAGYFRPDGRLAGVALDAEPPPDHLLGPLAVHLEVIAACQLAANLVASISSSGDVNPCSFLGPAFDAGNILARPFAAIWRASQTFRELRGSDGAFRGGCRARALAAHGDAYARDPWHDAWLGDAASPPPLANLAVSRRKLPIAP